MVWKRPSIGRCDNRRQNWRVVRDCITADGPRVSSRPGHLPQWLPVPSDGSNRVFRRTVFSKGAGRQWEARVWEAIASCSSSGSAAAFSSAFSNSVDMPQFHQRKGRTAMPRATKPRRMLQTSEPAASHSCGFFPEIYATLTSADAANFAAITGYAHTYTLAGGASFPRLPRSQGQTPPCLRNSADDRDAPQASGIPYSPQSRRRNAHKGQTRRSANSSLKPARAATPGPHW